MLSGDQGTVRNRNFIFPFWTYYSHTCYTENKKTGKTAEVKDDEGGILRTIRGCTSW